MEYQRFNTPSVADKEVKGLFLSWIKIPLSAPGMWRCGQPSPRLALYMDRGLQQVQQGVRGI